MKRLILIGLGLWIGGFGTAVAASGSGASDVAADAAEASVEVSGAAGTPQDSSAVSAVAIPEGYELVDSVVLRQTARVDSSLVDKNIFSIMPVKSAGGPANVFIYQSGTLLSAMNAMKESNKTRQIPGFRVRIFSDNSQTARADAEATMQAFENRHPDVPAYISYSNPYFKVTVGDFRTRSEAMQFMKEILPAFPKAFIVREGISYPAIDKDRPAELDTIQILKPVTGELISL